MRLKANRLVVAALAGLLLALSSGASGRAPVSVRAEGIDASKEAGRLERTRAAHGERLRKSRRVVDKYRKRNRGALSAYRTRGGKRKPPARSPQARKRNASAARGEYARRFRARVHAPSPPPRPVSVSGGAEIAAHFAAAPLHVVANALAALTGANVVVAEEIAAKPLSFRAERSPWRDLLAAVTRAQDWEVRDDDGFIRVHERRDGDNASTERSASAQRNVDLLRFFHVAPADMKKAVAPLFTGTEDKPAMSVDERTGSLVVKGAAEDVDLVAALTGKLDRPVRQVLIETFIVEAGRGLERALGARLGLDRFDSEGVIRVGGVAGAADSAERLVVDLPVASPAGGVGFLFDGERLKLELTALEREGKTRIVSNPRIFTLNGREAVIFQGDEVPYFSVSENGTQTEFKEAGVRLAVTPRIVGDGNLIIEVTVNKDTVDTRVQNPPITRRQIKTALLVADGAMVVIGGIYFDTRVDSETRVPVIGRVPVLGRLFKRSQNTRDFRELLVFIAPKIVGASM